MLAKVIKFFTSLHLTVWCLAAALVLVFAGTIAQVKMGLYQAQENYFQSFVVWWSPAGADFKIPVWPGGYLLGTILLINLIASHISRFKYTKKKAGIILIHLGLILLLLGQLFTELFQVESYMAIREGETKNYSESHRTSELAIIDTSNPDHNHVVAIPETHLEDGAEITHPDLPFPVKVKKYWVNSTPRLSDGQIEFAQQPYATAMDDRNIPVATIEIPGADKEEVTVSNWRVESRLLDALRKNFGPMQVNPIAGAERFIVNGKTYEAVMRPERYYKPFSLHLIDFRFDRYSGTSIPKNYSSEVRLVRPETGEDREILIYMNNPLRYNGETYFQASFDERDERGTVLQVVRNPSWLTPYISCILVSLGLLVQFMSHLFGFAKKRRTA